MADTETVAVLGAGGTMGLPMARNIARAGLTVRAWNRSREKARPLAGDGVTIVDSPGEATEGAGILVTMLADTDAVVEAMTDVFSRVREGAIWLQMSTIGEEGAERCIGLAGEHGLEFVDAPVLGTKKPAEDGALVVLASGPERLRHRVDPVFDAVGQKTMWLGDAGQGTLLKLVVNSWVLTVVEGCAETVALAQGLGLDPALLLEAIEGGTLDLPYLRMKTNAILDRDFAPMFRLVLAAKDAGLIEEAANARKLRLPLFSLIHRQMIEAAEEHGDEDMIATYFASAPGAATA
jgi:3-hydroxyisobutyrate dehydrogenase